MTLIETPPPSLLGCRPRWSTPRTERPTFGGRAAEIAEGLGLPLMPWQRHVVDVAMEVNPDTGLLVYREVNLTVPRQSGKTTLLLAVMVHRALAFGEAQRQWISYTAQTRNDARHKWEDEHLVTLSHSPYKRLYRTRRATGSEAILWNNGSVHDLMASTQKSGHGPTLDLGVIDEAFAQIDWRLEQAMKPAMITRSQPQLWAVSTAGTSDSVYLWSKVENGRQRAELGFTDATAYFEWSAGEEADPADPATWRSCMPALGHTVTEAAVAADFASMPLGEFRRAYLNQWTVTRAEPIIAVETWASCLDERSQAAAPLVFAIDITPDHAASSIAVCGPRPDGRGHLEVVDHRTGTEWVVDRAVELRDRWHPVAFKLDPAGPAGALLPKLAQSGIKAELVNGREYAQACGLFFEQVTTGAIRHLGQADLAAALDGATKRPLGDAWAWSRSNSSVDISPLVAVTLALWGSHAVRQQVPAAGFKSLDDYFEE